MKAPDGDFNQFMDDQDYLENESVVDQDLDATVQEDLDCKKQSFYTDFEYDFADLKSKIEH